MFSKVYYTACSWAFCFLILGVVFPHIVTVKKKKTQKTDIWDVSDYLKEVSILIHELMRK